jgi:hypothetical protein
MLTHLTARIHTKADPIGQDTGRSLNANAWAAAIQEYNDHNGQVDDESDSE